MPELSYELGYFKDQVDLWTDVSSQTQKIAGQLKSVSALKTWWPNLDKVGLTRSFDNSTEINQLHQSLVERLDEARRAAEVIAEALEDTAIAYAETTAKSEAEGYKLAYQILHPVTGSSSAQEAV